MTKAIQEKVILNEIKEISLNRIGGNIPKYFDDKQDCISEMMFYGCFEHPLKTNFVLSIFLPKNHDIMLDNNIYPNCAIKVFTHPKSEESEITSFTNMDLNRIYFEPYRKANSDDLSGLVTVGGELQLIQEEEYYYKNLEENGYLYLMSIDEDYYPDNLLNGNYPFQKLTDRERASRSPEKTFNPDMECVRYARGFYFSDDLNTFFEVV